MSHPFFTVYDFVDVIDFHVVSRRQLQVLDIFWTESILQLVLPERLLFLSSGELVTLVDEYAAIFSQTFKTHVVTEYGINVQFEPDKSC